MARASCPDCGGASGLWRSIRTAAKHPGCGGHSARGTYCCGAIRPIAARALAAFYLNVFVAVVQAFQKLPLLRTLAPTGSEPPFAITQLLVLAGFIALGVIAARRFHPGAPAPAQA